MTIEQGAALLAAQSTAGVTAVVPTHRRPALLRRAVASILAQDYAGPVEIVVVFDACAVEVPDLPVPEGWVLRGVANTRSRGLAGARNTGIIEAEHEFVAFLDDDDHWLPGKLARQMAAFAAHPEARLVGTAMQVDDGRSARTRLVPSEIVTHAQLVDNRFAGLHSSSFVFRRAHLVDDLGLVDEELPGSYGEDTDLLLKSSQLSPVRVVNEPLVSVTWQGQSLFFGKWGQFADGLLYLHQRHPQLATSQRAVAQAAFALGAAGRGREARRWARRALRANPRSVKAWLAIAMSWHLVSADRIARVASRFGRGV